MNIGDLVKFIGSTQLYFHFPTDEWYNLNEGECGLIINIESAHGELVYRVKMMDDKKSTCWLYEDELYLLSGNDDE
tara:strand:+ start:222 stop:449 length:228 start_codon:yes stop_codon:yes gene_type:complete